MHGWIDPYFEQAESAVAPGHIWSAQPIALPPRHGLKLAKVDPKDDCKLDFEVVARADVPFDHPPIHSLGLRSCEALVIATAALACPVVVLGATTGGQLRPDAAPGAEIVMVVPIHAADQHDERTRRRVRGYGFTNAFYLPACERPRFAEGVARLDHVQPVPRASLAGHRGLKLSADALDALVEWFVAFTTNRLPDDSLILEYRRENLTADP